MSDKTFAQAFESNMKTIGLPMPSSIFGTVSTTLGTVGALAGAIAKVGATATISEIFLTAPIAAGSTVAAAAIGEIIAVCGGVAAAFYVGACIGSVLVAAYETLGVFDLTKIVSWLDEVQNKLGKSVVEFMENAIANHGRLSPVRKSVVLAKKMSSNLQNLQFQCESRKYQSISNCLNSRRNIATNSIHNLK
jgi:hypothetical protein